MARAIFKNGNASVVASALSADEAESLLDAGWVRVFVDRLPEGCKCSLGDVAEPAPEPKVAPVPVPTPPPSDDDVEVGVAVDDDARPLEPGDEVKTLYKGEVRTGVVLTIAGGKDKGKVRVNLDMDDAKYREVLLADTKRI